MLIHAALAFYRSLLRHRLYAALNVFGLGAGIAVFLTLTFVVGYERSYNRWIPGAADIYRLDQTWSLPGRTPQEYADTPFVALPLLLADFPQIQAGIRLQDRGTPVQAGSIIGQETVTYVDQNFFDVLALPMTQGEAAGSLADPAGAVITQSTARRYFGTANSLGRTILLSQDGVKRAFTVTGVLRDLPGNSTIRLSILAPLTPAIAQGIRSTRSWNNSSGDVYMKFKSGADARAVSAALADFIGRRASGNGDNQIGPDARNQFALSLVSLPEAHFHDVAVSATIPGTDPRLIYSLAAVGSLALVLAAINDINLATARSGLRAREVALRKVLGATRGALLTQFLIEAVILVSASALIGLALTELALPVVNALGAWDIHIDYLRTAEWLGALIICVGLGAGLYPAILLASYQPAAVLASARTPTGGRIGARARNLLVLVQFSTAIALTICTLVIDQQASFLRKADRGFDRRGLIIIETMQAADLLDRQTSILDSIRAVPGVASATISDREPNSDSSSSTTVTVPGLKGPAPNLLYETVGRDYFRTYGISLLAGRVFDDGHRADDRNGGTDAGQTRGVVINRAALAVLGHTDPASILGQQLSTASRSGPTENVVIGVVQDVRYMSSHAPVAAQFYLYDTKRIEAGEAAVRFTGVPRSEIMNRLQSAWQRAVPDHPFVARTADERLEEFYRPDAQRAALFSIGAILALGIACVGMYGLASFNTARRTREIGIRKTLGASAPAVLVLLVRQFIAPVLFANLIAWPAAWVAMRTWLSGFDQRIALSASFFVEAALLAIGLSILTVLGQAMRVAGAEPAHALRHE